MLLGHVLQWQCCCGDSVLREGKRGLSLCPFHVMFKQWVGCRQAGGGDRAGTGQLQRGSGGGCARAACLREPALTQN